MKLWILRPTVRLPNEDDPWKPWYDKAFGFVVQAETEEQARALADSEAGDENHHDYDVITNPDFRDTIVKKTRNPWLDSKYTTCIPLEAVGTPKVIMRDFASA